jgi:hypothetical protein
VATDRGVARVVIYVRSVRQAGKSLPQSSAARLSAAQSVDFGVFGEAPEPLFGKGELAIDSDLEHTGNALNEFDLGTVLFLEPCPRTEGSW